MQRFTTAIATFFRAEEDTFARDFTLAMVALGAVLPAGTVLLTQFLMGAL